MTFRQTNPCLCKRSHEGQLHIMSGDTAGPKINWGRNTQTVDTKISQLKDRVPKRFKK